MPATKILWTQIVIVLTVAMRIPAMMTGIASGSWSLVNFVLLNRVFGRLVVLKNGRYDNVPIDTVTATKKVVNVKEHYSIERLRPTYQSFEMKPLFLMTSERS